MVHCSVLFISYVNVVYKSSKVPTNFVNIKNSDVDQTLRRVPKLLSGNTA